MAARVEIVTGVMLPPDLATFMAQAKQMGFAPTFVTVAKAALTPKGIASFPDALGENLSGEVYWEPQYPFRSSLTGETTTALAGAQWRADGAGGFRLVYTFNATPPKLRRMAPCARRSGKRWPAIVAPRAGSPEADPPIWHGDGGV